MTPEVEALKASWDKARAEWHKAEAAAKSARDVVAAERRRAEEIALAAEREAWRAFLRSNEAFEAYDRAWKRAAGIR